MIKTLKYIALICSSGLLLSCGGNDAEDKKAMEPEEVVKAFTSAVAGGDFAGALELCDTVAMKGYIEERQNEWHMLEMKDSSVYAIAAHMLEGTETEITEVIKEGNSRHMFYTVSFGGKEKEKVMILQKEEGEWKVKAISDRH